MIVPAPKGTRLKEKKTKEYRAWSHMKTRCNNVNYEFYDSYGGRGIRVCERWSNSYDLFIKDVGRAPTSNHSIDRIDVDGNYEPGNVRWADMKTQQRNRSNNKQYEVDGIIATLPEHCERYGLDYHMVFRRISIGWDVLEALKTPKNHCRARYVTPQKVFRTVNECAKFFGIKPKTASARFCSKTFKDWYKTDKLED